MMKFKKITAWMLIVSMMAGNYLPALADTGMVYTDDHFEESVISNSEMLNSSNKVTPSNAESNDETEENNTKITPSNADEDVISVEVHMKEDNKSFSAIAGDAEISISEIKKNALKNVDHIEVEETEIPDIKDILKDNLSNKEIADYKAFDITLFNESGEEIEPDGNVSVNIKNIYTDAEYDDIKIFHLMDSDASILNDDRVAYPDAYKVEEISKGIKNELDSENEISFTAESFSKYIVTFIKTPIEYKTMSFVFKKEIADGQYEEIDLGEDNLSIGVDFGTDGHNPRIVDILEAHGLGEVTVGGEEYAYDRSFYYDKNGSESDVSLITKKLYDGIKGIGSELNVIYKNKEDVFVGARIRCLTDTGDIDHELISQIKVGNIVENRPLEAGFVFNRAYVEKVSYTNPDVGSESNKIEITGIKKIGPYIYYKTRNGRNSRLFYENDSERIVLEYVQGNTLHVKAEYANSATPDIGNKVTIDGKTDYDLPIDDVITLSRDRDTQVVIEIAQGYDIVVSGVHDYNSSSEENQKRKYTINIKKDLIQGQELNIVFNKTDKILDYSYLINRNNPETGNLHGSKITIQQGKNDSFSNVETNKPYIANIQDGNDVRIIIENSTVIRNNRFVMDAFAVNGNAMNIPDDPRNGNTATEGQLLDEHKDVIATYQITASYQETGLAIKKIKRVYTITFKEIKSSLKVTNGNLKAEHHKELLLKSIDEGIRAILVDQNGNPIDEEGAPTDKIHFVRANDVFAFKDETLYFKIVAEDGYYVENVSFENNIGSVVNPDITGVNNVYKLSNKDYRNDTLFKLNIKAGKIAYHFKYWNDNTVIKDDTTNIFYLTNKESNTKEVTEGMVDSQDLKFVGWKLNKNDNSYFLKGNTIPKDNIISKDSLNESDLREKTIDLYAYFDNKLDEVATKYYVVVSIEGQSYGKDGQFVKYPYSLTELYGPEEGIVGDKIRIDDRFTKHTITGQEIVKRYEQDGYIIDAGSNNVLELVKESEKNIFTVHLIKKIKNVNVSAHGPGSVDVTVQDDNIEHNKIIEQDTNFNILCSEGDKLKFNPTGTIKQIVVDNKLLSEEEKTKLLTEGFTVTPKVNGSREHKISIYFDNKRNIKYESGKVAAEYVTNMPQDQEAEINSKVTLTQPSANGYTFNGWMSSFDSKVYNSEFTMPDSDVALTAQWSEDYNTNYWAEVTFEAENGSFNDGNKISKDYVYIPNGTSGKLKTDQIPAVGNKPDPGYKKGYWTKKGSDSEVNLTNEEISKPAIFVYKYLEDHTQSEYWSRVIFEAVNGTFAGGKHQVVKYVYRPNKGDGILPQKDIPKPETPNPGYKNTGIWNPEFNGDIVVNNSIVYYTYTFEADYEQKNYWAKVTFNSLNGTFYNKDQQIIAYVYKADGVSGNLELNQIPETGNYPNIGYTVGSWDTVPDVNTAISTDTVYTYTYAEDANGNGIPDDKETKYTLTYTDGVDTEEIFADEIHQLIEKAAVPKYNGGAEPTRVGYLFTGWHHSVDGKVYTTVDGLTMPKENLTLTAQWSEDANGNGIPDDKEQKYTLTYTDGVDTEEVFADESYQLIEKATVPKYNGGAEPTRAGYVFTGWHHSVDGKVYTTVDGLTMPKSNLTLTAQWSEDANGNVEADDKEQKYALTYTDGVDTEEVFADESHQLIEKVALPKYNGGVEPTRVGYVFIGWHHSVDGNVYTTVDGLAMPKSNLTLTAQWSEDANGNGEADDKEQKYTLTYTDGVDTEEIFADESHQLIEKATVPKYNGGAEPTRVGYVFTGWHHSVDGKVYTTVDGLTMPKKNLTLTAQWSEDANGNGIPDDKEEKYTVTYKDGLEGKLFGDITIGNLIKNQITPACDKAMEYPGYVFTGWDPEVSIKVTGNATYTAQWSEDANGNGIPDRDESNDGSSSDNNRNDGLGSSESNPIINVLHGHWMHVDPNDNFKEISVPVPYDKDPSEVPEYHRWKFILNNGTMIYNKKVYIKNPYAQPGQPSEGWFYFDNNGIMQFGWHLDNGKWYYLHADSDGMLGTRIEGWHFDKHDNRWYYLKPGTGEMLISWQFINGKWYYFNIGAPEFTWNYDPTLSKWIFNGSKHRPYGSMYANENTPDGYFVGKDGALVK